MTTAKTEQGIALCSMCKDSVVTFICSECLAEGIEAWLPKPVALMFQQFHGQLLSHFRATPDITFEYCMHCKALRPSSLCPFCYLSEAAQWLRMSNRWSAEILRCMLPMGACTQAERDGYPAERYTPLTETESLTKMEGLCDHCEEYAHQLTSREGGWLCNNCCYEQAE